MPQPHHHHDVTFSPTTSTVAFAPFPSLPFLRHRPPPSIALHPRCPRSLPVDSPQLPSSATPKMSSAAAELRHRIASVQSAEKIVSALRLVAAARIRNSSNAALRARPFAQQLQSILADLVHHISVRRIDIPAVAAAAQPAVTLADMHGPFLADPAVQKALLDRMYLTVLHHSPFLSSPSSPSSSSLRGGGRERGRPGYLTIVVVIAADRKFCGSYNKDVLSRAAIRLRQLQAAGSRVQLVVVGRIAQSFFNRDFPHLPVMLYLPVSSASTAAEQTATTLSHSLLSEFIAGGVHRVEVVYTRFVSLIATAPSTRTLLPLTPTGLEGVGDELLQLTVTSRNGRVVPTTTSSGTSTTGNHFADLDAVVQDGEHSSHLHSLLAARRRQQQLNDSSARSKKLYAVSDEEAVLLLNSMLPMYFTSQLIRIMREAIASEQVSRLAAMTTATDNARELVSRLQAQYNKQRQARITTEIIEVMSSVSS